MFQSYDILNVYNVECNEYQRLNNDQLNQQQSNISDFTLCDTRRLQAWYAATQWWGPYVEGLRIGQFDKIVLAICIVQAQAEENVGAKDKGNMGHRIGKEVGFGYYGGNQRATCNNLEIEQNLNQNLK